MPRIITFFDDELSCSCTSYQNMPMLRGDERVRSCEHTCAVAEALLQEEASGREG